MERNLARGAGKAERDPTAQHVQVVCGHVVPVPASGFRHRLERSNVLGPDAPVGDGGEPEVAVLGVLAKPLAVPGRISRAHARERGQRLRKLARAVVTRCTFVVHRRCFCIAIFACALLDNHVESPILMFLQTTLLRRSVAWLTYPFTAPAVSPAMNHF